MALTPLEILKAKLRDKPDGNQQGGPLKSEAYLKVLTLSDVENWFARWTVGRKA